MNAEVLEREKRGSGFGMCFRSDGWLVGEIHGYAWLEGPVGTVLGSDSVRESGVRLCA